MDPTVDSRTGVAHSQHGTAVSSHGMGQGSATGVHGQSTNQGPHSSNMANKLDPRVDSDRDHRHDPTSRVGGYGQTQDPYAGTGATSTGIGHGVGPTASGPGHAGTASDQQYHSSNMANKLDPRIDSDRDHRNDPASRVGGYGQTQDTYTGTGATSTGMSHGAGAHTVGVTDSGIQGYGTGVTESKRVHDSKLLNKLDPATKTDSAGQPI